MIIILLTRCTHILSKYYLNNKNQLLFTLNLNLTFIIIIIHGAN